MRLFFNCVSSVVDRQLICALCDKSMKIIMYIPLRPKFSFRRGGIEVSDLGSPGALFMAPSKIGRIRQTLKLCEVITPLPAIQFS